MKTTLLFGLPGDTSEDIRVTAKTERDAVVKMFKALRCDFGPLSVEPADLAALQYAVANAFGDEYFLLPVSEAK